MYVCLVNGHLYAMNNSLDIALYQRLPSFLLFSIRMWDRDEKNARLAFPITFDRNTHKLHKLIKENNCKWAFRYYLYKFSFIYLFLFFNNKKSAWCDCEGIMYIYCMLLFVAFLANKKFEIAASDSVIQFLNIQNALSQAYSLFAGNGFDSKHFDSKIQNLENIVWSQT